MSRSRLLVAALAVSATLVQSAAADAQTRRALAPPPAPKRFFDIRDAHPTPRAPSAATRSARSRLRSAGARVGVDARTGNTRFLAGRGAPLSRESAGDRRDSAERFLRSTVAALGLSRTDPSSLRLERRDGIP